MVLLESFLADAQIFKTTFKNIKGGSHVSKKEKNRVSHLPILLTKVSIEV